MPFSPGSVLALIFFHFVKSSIINCEKPLGAKLRQLLSYKPTSNVIFSIYGQYDNGCSLGAKLLVASAQQDIVHLFFLAGSDEDTFPNDNQTHCR